MIVFTILEVVFLVAQGLMPNVWGFLVFRVLAQMFRVYFRNFYFFGELKIRKFEFSENRQFEKFEIRGIDKFTK